MEGDVLHAELKNERGSYVHAEIKVEHGRHYVNDVGNFLVIGMPGGTWLDSARNERLEGNIVHAEL